MLINNILVPGVQTDVLSKVKVSNYFVTQTSSAYVSSMLFFFCLIQKMTSPLKEIRIYFLTPQYVTRVTHDKLYLWNQYNTSSY